MGEGNGGHLVDQSTRLRDARRRWLAHGVGLRAHGSCDEVRSRDVWVLTRVERPIVV
jgi:hypothetical protein